MPEESGSVSVPKWHIALLSGALFILLSTMSTAVVAYQVALGKDIRDLRERVVALETMHGITHPDGGK